MSLSFSSHPNLLPLSSWSQVNQGRKRHFVSRSPLPLQANHLWRIETGVVRTITFLEDGSLQTLGIWSEGDVIGQPLTRIEPYHVECLSQVEATLFSVNEWQQDTSALIKHCQQLEELMLIRSYRKVDMMVLKLLNWLAQRFGKVVQEGQLIELRLTHQDLADILGTTRVTITRVLSQLEEQGFIDRLPLQRIVVKTSQSWHYEI